MPFQRVRANMALWESQSQSCKCHSPLSSINPPGQTVSISVHTKLHRLKLFAPLQLSQGSPRDLQVSLCFMPLQLQVAMGSHMHPLPQLPGHDWVLPSVLVGAIPPWEPLPCHGHKLFHISPGMLNSLHLLVLFRVLRQSGLPLAQLVAYGDRSWESFLGLLTITSLPAPLFGYFISSGTPILSESPGILRPQWST